MSFAFRKLPIELLPGSAVSHFPNANTIAKGKVPRLPAATARKFPAPNIPPSMRLIEAQRLADRGCLGEAIERCEGILAEHGPSVDAYYLLAVIHDAMRDPKGAAECYRRAIYLDPEHVDSLTHLALLAETEGDGAGADRLRERARRVCAKGTA